MSNGVRYTAAKRRQVEAARNARNQAELAEQATWTLDQHIAWTLDYMDVTAGRVTVNGEQIAVEDFARTRMAAARSRVA